MVDLTSQRGSSGSLNADFTDLVLDLAEAARDLDTERELMAAMSVDGDAPSENGIIAKRLRKAINRLSQNALWWCGGEVDRLVVWSSGRLVGNAVMVVAELVLVPHKSAQRRRLTARPPDLPVVAAPSRVELSALAT